MSESDHFHKDLGKNDFQHNEISIAEKLSVAG